jgi:hypothetical protein
VITARSCSRPKIPETTPPIRLGWTRPYLLIPRQFETPGGGRCYIETHGHGYIARYPLRLTDFGSTRLAVEIERKSASVVEVSYALDTVEFKKVRRIVN